MRYLITLFFALLLCACDQKKAEMEKRLRDTLEILRIKTDFKPMPENEAYVFLNKYYLPRLDSLKIGRRIYVYPLNGRDFSKILKSVSAIITAKYTGDTASAKKLQAILEPPNYSCNKKYQWNAKQLQNSAVIIDSFIIALNHKHVSFEEREKWFKYIKPGYMVISYLQYNAMSKKLFIREWLENASSCGTGREREFWFEKTATGWEKY